MRVWLIGLAAFGCTAAQAQTTISFSNFADVSALTFAGDATGPVTVNNAPALRLVSAGRYQSGAAYLTTPIVLGPGGAFSTTFQFRVMGTTVSDWSDGMTFVIAASPAGLGGPDATGSYLGYQGVTHSLAVEYDTYYASGSDKLPNEVAVTTNGNTTTIDNPAGSAGEPYGVSQCENFGPSQRGCLSDGRLWTTMITYNGQYMNVRVQDGTNAPVQVITNYKIDLKQALGGTTTAYVGFTAGTGEDYANFYIYDWKLTY